MRPEPAAITEAQVRAIHACLHARGIEDPEYREMLAARYNVTTCKDLTRRQAAMFISLLSGGHRALARPKTRRPIQHPHQPAPEDTPGVVSLPSPAQRKLMAELVTEVDWYTPDGYQAWMEKALGIKRVRTSRDAHRVIRGLKGLKDGGHHAA